ncbi:stage III sporulation protein AG [Lachnospiraceae bacterium KM106-2]|nr:stage III sporulation protein AG [Lachnospiraceae bacterium KM106-2]
MGIKDLFKQLKERRNTEGKEKKPLSIKDIGLPKLIILLVCGVIILMPMNFNLFNKSKKSSSVSTTTSNTSSNGESKTNEEYTKEMENKLKQGLSLVNGVGKVEVMITLKSSKTSVVLKDTPTEENTTKEKDSTGGTRDNTTKKSEEKTVMSTENGSSIPYEIKKYEPEIEGVVVIAKGAKSPSIQNEIVDAVLALFEVPAHKIKVMSMD